MEEQKKYEVAKIPEMKITIEDVKKYIAPNASDKELFMFMGICKSYGLNPFKREIHFVKYGTSPASIIVGYENYLKRADRTGKLDGWKCWIDSDKIGEKAIIEIQRKDQKMPVHWEVYRKEFDKAQSTWKTMPTFMLKKVAIAQGFRLAFPDELGGMPYIPEELPQTKDVTSEQLPTEVVIPAGHEQGDDISDNIMEKDIPEPESLKNGASSAVETGKQAGSESPKKERTPAQKKLEVLISEAGIDRELFKDWLFNVAWLVKREGKLSLNDLNEKHLKELLARWDSAKQKFSLWVDANRGEG